MNLIESTQKHDDREAAEDALAGLRLATGFVFGYVRLPARAGGKCEVVSIFDCAEGSEPARGQRRVLFGEGVVSQGNSPADFLNSFASGLRRMAAGAGTAAGEVYTWLAGRLERLAGEYARRASPGGAAGRGGRV